MQREKGVNESAHFIKKGVNESAHFIKKLQLCKVKLLATNWTIGSQRWAAFVALLLSDVWRVECQARAMLMLLCTKPEPVAFRPPTLGGNKRGGVC